MNEQIYNTIMPTKDKLNQSNTQTPTLFQNTSNETATIVVAMNNHLVSVNPSAAAMLNVLPETMKGQSISVLGKAFVNILSQPTKPGAATIVHLDNGNTVIANMRTVVGQNQQPMGKVITLQEVKAQAEKTIPSFQVQNNSGSDQHAVGNLQSQIQNMQDLIEMVPRFSNNRFWQNLLIEHMQKLVEDMTTQVQKLTPVSPSA